MTNRLPRQMAGQPDDPGVRRDDLPSDPPDSLFLAILAISFGPAFLAGLAIYQIWWR